MLAVSNAVYPTRADLSTDTRAIARSRIADRRRDGALIRIEADPARLRRDAGRQPNRLLDPDRQRLQLPLGDGHRGASVAWLSAWQTIRALPIPRPTPSSPNSTQVSAISVAEPLELTGASIALDGRVKRGLT
jgi:hypothetical protein